MAFKRKEIENIEGLLKDGKKKFVRYDVGVGRNQPPRVA